MRPVFADTFYYLSLLNSGDSSHGVAVSVTRRLRRKMVTTAWVLTEVADAMSAPGNREVFSRLFKELRNNRQVTIIEPHKDLFDEGIHLYGSRPDKDWSLTDCISFLVMQQEGLTEALTGDHHFEQAGFKALLTSS